MLEAELNEDEINDKVQIRTIAQELAEKHNIKKDDVPIEQQILPRIPGHISKRILRPIPSPTILGSCH
jgi:hypothetical protein